MATVYLAEDLKHERKVLKPALAAIVGTERFLAGSPLISSSKSQLNSGDRFGLGDRLVNVGPGVGSMSRYTRSSVRSDPPSRSSRAPWCHSVPASGWRPEGSR